MTSAPTTPLRRRIERNWRRLNGPARVAGVDLARGLAVLGMLAAHLLWLGSLSWTEPSTWGAIVNGRSSILFATLAGVSLGLSTGGPRPPSGAGLGRARLRVVIRALLIWLIGVLLISLDVPAAIILPTYAVIFVLALPLLAQRASRLFLAAAIVVLVASPVVVWANASPWWESYEGWLTGLYIGWNYLFPLWVAFTLAGLGLARAGMWSRRVQWAALGLGMLLAVAGYSLSPGAESSEESADRPFLEACCCALPDGCRGSPSRSGQHSDGAAAIEGDESDEGVAEHSGDRAEAEVERERDVFPAPRVLAERCTGSQGDLEDGQHAEHRGEREDQDRRHHCSFPNFAAR